LIIVDEERGAFAGGCCLGVNIKFWQESVLAHQGGRKRKKGYNSCSCGGGSCGEGRAHGSEGHAHEGAGREKGAKPARQRRQGQTRSRSRLLTEHPVIRFWGRCYGKIKVADQRLDNLSKNQLLLKQKKINYGIVDLR